METITYIASKEKRNLFSQNTFTYIASNQQHSLDICFNLKDKNIIKENIFLPLFIFRNGLSGLEAISKYLKEIIGLRYCQIADLLNRDDRTIWDAYNSAKQKNGSRFTLEKFSFSIPLNIFNNRSLSILETLTTYLKEELNLRYCQIASLLNKDARTIWTAYNRAKKKIMKNG
jgi:predicted DNA-binding protein (UPF0251 family)